MLLMFSNTDRGSSGGSWNCLNIKAHLLSTRAVGNRNQVKERQKCVIDLDLHVYIYSKLTPPPSLPTLGTFRPSHIHHFDKPFSDIFDFWLIVVYSIIHFRTDKICLFGTAHLVQRK